MILTINEYSLKLVLRNIPLRWNPLRHFGATCYLHLQDNWILVPCSGEISSPTSLLVALIDHIRATFPYNRHTSSSHALQCPPNLSHPEDGGNTLLRNVEQDYYPRRCNNLDDDQTLNTCRKCLRTFIISPTSINQLVFVMVTGRPLWESTWLQLLCRRISGFKKWRSIALKAIEFSYFSFCVAVMEKNN